MSWTVCISGPEKARARAEVALEDARIPILPDNHHALMDWQSKLTAHPSGKKVKEPHAFITVDAEHPDDVVAAIAKVPGWVLRVHYATPDAPKPQAGIESLLKEMAARIAALEAQSARPPMRGGAMESPGFANQASSYSAEVTRRAVMGWLARTGAGTPGIVSGGLVGASDLAVSAPVSGMSVNVATGEAYVGGSEGAVQGAYYARNASQTNLVIAAASGSNPRVDIICLTIADTGYTEPAGVSGNAATLQVVTGTPTAGATLVNLNGVATLPASSLLLAYCLVPISATNIITADIANVATVAQPGLNTAFLRTGVDASKPAAAAANAGEIYEGTDSGALYLSDGSALRTVYGSRGAVNISASESRTNVAYGTLTTPDQVTGIVLPTNGLIAVWYQATWQESVDSAAAAAIFVGAHQLVVANTSGGPNAQSAGIGGGNTGKNAPLSTTNYGLIATGDSATQYSGDLTTGQLVGSATNGGPCYISAAAGTYTISVQFKSTSGSVTASNRKLWVQALPFS